jgi:hypothetical protein
MIILGNIQEEITGTMTGAPYVQDKKNNFAIVVNPKAHASTFAAIKIKCLLPLAMLIKIKTINTGKKFQNKTLMFEMK